MDLIDEEKPPMHDLRVCMSGNGQGEIAAVIKDQLTALGAQFVKDAPNPFNSKYDPSATHADTTCEWAHVAICTTGGMRIGDPATMLERDVDYLYHGNYFLPRCFTERHIAAMRAEKVEGLIIHLGSNAATFGNVGAEDYAGFKAGLRKYLELRGREVRDQGIRISHLGFGGVKTQFWDKAVTRGDAERAKSIVPGARKPLTAQEAAAVVVATIMLPPNVVVRDALIVSKDYQ